jgi:hypothetical protein
MLNYGTQNYWRLRDENRRRDLSILDTALQRGGMRPGDALDDDGQVMKSPDTERAIQSFATAPDLHEKSHWLNKILEYWRADNSAAGLSVLAHKPLPDTAAGHVAEALTSVPEWDRQTVLSSILAKSDPGVKLHVSQQLGDILTGALAGTPPGGRAAVGALGRAMASGVASREGQGTRSNEGECTASFDIRASQ